MDDIQIEEIGKQLDEITARIENLEKKGEKTPSFINSPIFIWALSSIVLGLFGFTYDWYQSQKKIELNIQELETEISYRLSSIRY